MENLVNVLITVLKKHFLNLKKIIINKILIIFNVLYTVLKSSSNILIYIFGSTLFDKKGQGNKKVTLTG